MTEPTTVEEVVVTGKRPKRRKYKPFEALLENPKALGQGALDLGSRAVQYAKSGRLGSDLVRVGEDPWGAVGRGLTGFAANISEDLKEHPVKTVAEFLPLVGSVLAARDASALREQAEEARLRGDEDTARRLEELAAITAGSIAAGVLPAGRAAAKVGIKAAERGVVRDAARLAEKYGVGTEVGLRGADDPRMISTRRPTEPNFAAEGNPDEQLLIQSGDALRRNPAAFEKNMAMLAEEPFMQHANTADPEKLYDYATKEGSKNLQFITNELMTPSQVDAAKPWYVTAHNLAGRNAKIVGQPVEAGAGVMAVLSPQTPWDANVAKAERLASMYASGFPTPEDAVKRWVRERRALGPKRAGAVASLPDADLLRIANTPMAELAPNSFDRYAKVVLSDAVQNPPEIRAILPTGEYGDVSGTITWGGGGEVNRALNILNDPSMLNISRQMEGGGKVPSFYNNMVAPYSTAPISTIDTHSTGAFSLFPGGGNDPIVYRGMGLSAPQKGMPPGAASPATTGAKGLYGPIADAHTLAGKDMDFQPRETQSVTWEGVRGLWGQSGKTASLKNDIADIWRAASSPDDARYAIAERLGRPVPRVYPGGGVGSVEGLSAFGTSEATPGAVTGHLPNLTRIPEGEADRKNLLAEREDYAADPRRSWIDATGNDIIYGALGIEQRPTLKAQGVFMPDGGTALEFNPAFVARAAVNPQPGVPGIPPDIRSKMVAAEAFRSAIGGQEAGALHMPSFVDAPEASGSLFVPQEGRRSIEEVERLRTLGSKYGLGDVVDSGQGVTMTSFWPEAPAGSATEQALREGLNDKIRDILPGAQPRQASIDSEYIDYKNDWKSAPGSGAVTRQMLNYIENSGAPDAIDALDTPEIRQRAGDLMRADYEKAAATKQPVREDLQNLRRIVSEDGPKGLRAALDRKEFLPALLAALGLGAAATGSTPYGSDE